MNSEYISIIDPMINSQLSRARSRNLKLSGRYSVLTQVSGSCDSLDLSIAPTFATTLQALQAFESSITFEPQDIPTNHYVRKLRGVDHENPADASRKLA
jgi:hypothetical protein